MSASIFISFASQDRKVATTLCQALEGRGFQCWISSRDILPGENFQVAIVRAIRKSKLMLLVFTANSNNSAEMNKELALASQQKLTVVPLRIEDVAPNDAFAYEFATRQWIDFFSDWELAMNALAAQIANVLGPEDMMPVAPVAELVAQQPAAPQAPAPPAAPPPVAPTPAAPTAAAPPPAAPPPAAPTPPAVEPPAAAWSDPLPPEPAAPEPEPAAEAASPEASADEASVEALGADTGTIFHPASHASDAATLTDHDAAEAFMAADHADEPPAPVAPARKKGSPLPLIVGLVVVVALAAAAAYFVLGRSSGPAVTTASSAATAASSAAPVVTLAPGAASSAASSAAAPGAVPTATSSADASGATAASTAATAASEKASRHHGASSAAAKASGDAPLRANRSDIPY